MGSKQKTLWYFLKHLFFGITLTLNPQFLGSPKHLGNGIKYTRKWDHFGQNIQEMGSIISRKWDHQKSNIQEMGSLVSKDMGSQYVEVVKLQVQVELQLELRLTLSVQRGYTSRFSLTHYLGRATHGLRIRVRLHMGLGLHV